MSIFLNRVVSEYHHKRLSRFLPIETLNKRIETCEGCEHFRQVSCGVCGCSTFRFKEILLSPQPACPKRKHDDKVSSS